MVLILYATETGTAYAAALNIARRLSNFYHLGTPSVRSVASFPPEELSDEPFVIFVISTTGAGAFPREAQALWQALLNASLPGDLLDETFFAVFGLGDSSYEKFCWPAKLLSRRLLALGAKQLIERGEGDDQAQVGWNGALEKWMSSLTRALQDGAAGEAGEISDDGPSSHILLRDIPSVNGSAINGTGFQELGALMGRTNYYQATVSINQRTTAQDWFQDVRHIELDLEKSVAYPPGSTAIIHPVTPESDVDRFLNLVQWTEVDTPCLPRSDRILDDNLPLHPQPLREFLARDLNINAVPDRRFFEVLRSFAGPVEGLSNQDGDGTTDEDILDREREKLEEFLSPEGTDEMYDYVVRPRRTIVEVLSEFRFSARLVPKEWAWELLPRLRPREFSISSWSGKHAGQVHICVALVKYKTKLRAPREGICSKYLASLVPGNRLLVGIRAPDGGCLALPLDPEVPLICVGPGTGVAPMRAMIEARVGQAAKSTNLFSGHRSTLAGDAHYAAEFRDISSTGFLGYYPVASRDGAEGVARRYVQDVMREETHARMIWEAVGNKMGWLLISGSANKMPVAVKAAVRDAARRFGGMTEEQAQTWLSNLEREGRLIEECWS